MYLRASTHIGYLKNKKVQRIVILLLVMPHLMLSSYGIEAIYEIPTLSEHTCCHSVDLSFNIENACCDLSDDNENHSAQCDHNNCQSKGCTSTFQVSFFSIYDYSHEVFEKLIPKKLNTLIVNFISKDFHNIWIPPKNLA